MFLIQLFHIWLALEKNEIIIQGLPKYDKGCKPKTFGKDPDAGKDWRQEEKGTTEDEMVGWHHRLDGHEFEQTLGVGEGQGSLVCCSPWGCRVRHDWVTKQQIYHIKLLQT